MTVLKYLQAYPERLQDQVRQLIAEGRLEPCVIAALRNAALDKRPAL